MRISAARCCFVVFVMMCAPCGVAEDCGDKIYDALAPVSGSGLLFPAARYARIGSAFPFRSLSFELSPRAAESEIVRRAASRYEVKGVNLTVRLDLAENASLEDVPQLSSFADQKEAYVLHLDRHGGSVNATSIWGILRGLVTLRQLLFEECAFEAFVEDSASYSWRGVLVDTGRRYYPLDFWFRLLDSMERVKLNVVHWHVTDAEIAPFESASFPNVSELGALAPDAVYRSTDVAAIVRVAADRGIRIVPEFDGPYHAAAISRALPNLFCDDAFDVTNPKLYNDFLAPYLGDARSLFLDEVVHLGGDEVDTSCWNSSITIQGWMLRNNASLQELFPYYLNRTIAIARDVGFVKTMAWDDAFQAGARPSIVHAWRGKTWGGAVGDDDPWLVEAASRGFQTITSHGLYLTAGNSVDADIAVTWQEIYDRDLVKPLVDAGAAQFANNVLGANAAVWGTSVDRHTWESVAWPRLAVLAERLWSPQASFTPGNYSEFLPRLMLLRCRFIQRGSSPHQEIVVVSPLDDTKRVDKRTFLEQCDTIQQPRFL